MKPAALAAIHAKSAADFHDYLAEGFSNPAYEFYRRLRNVHIDAALTIIAHCGSRRVREAARVELARWEARR